MGKMGRGCISFIFGTQTMTWTVKNSGVQLSDNSKAYLNELAKILPFNITITDGFRTPIQQAVQMAETRQEQIFDGSGQNLDDVYKDKEQARAIQAKWPDTQAMSVVIKSYIAQGKYISRHLLDDAFDVRTIGGTENQLDTNQIRELVTTLKEIGLKVVEERDHVHVEVLKTFDPSQKKSNLLLIAIGIGLVLWTIS